MSAKTDPHAPLDGDIQSIVDQALVERYFHGLSKETELPDKDLSRFDTVTGHLALGGKRLPGISLVRVFNPVDDMGKEISDHTVVEIVTDDIPLLVDSVSMALDRHRARLYLRVHPILNVRRDSNGRLIKLNTGSKPASGYLRESYMHFRIEKISDSERRETIKVGIQKTLADVVATFRDRKSIQARVIDMVSTIGSANHDSNSVDTKHIDSDELAAFLRWIAADHFVFLGYTNFSAHDGKWQADSKSALGILANANAKRLSRLIPVDPSATHVEQELRITQSIERSRVHRDAWIDCVVVTIRENDKYVRHVVMGLFTSIAYGLRPEAIPYLRSKVGYVMDASELPEGGFGFRTLRDVLTTYPRTELFQADPELLLSHALEILELEARPRTHLVYRHDTHRDTHVCIVYLAKDRYSRELRKHIEQILMQAFDADDITHETRIDSNALAYVCFWIRPATLQPNVSDLQETIEHASIEWGQRLASSLEALSVDNELISRFCNGFPTAYTERFSEDDAARDVLRIAQALQKDRLGINVYSNDTSDSAGLGLRLFSPGSAIALSSILPLIENLGFEVGVERPYEIQSDEGSVIWLHDFSLRAISGNRVDSRDAYGRIEQALERAWLDEIENDRFNQLVLLADISWRQASLVRALCRYLRQTRIAYGENYIIDALIHNANIVSEIVKLFFIKLDPTHNFAKAEQRHRESKLLGELIETQLEAVASLDEDRILNALYNVVCAIVRTNYFQPDHEGHEKSVFAFKIDSNAVTGLPKPVPLFEIFVYSPSFEGIHLRAGKVARGGLRWSDRKEDFRTEVLGLMKAQVVKNAVIVPVGSKGGFIVRKAFGQIESMDRIALRNEVVRCYREFISSLLDVTDNLQGTKITHPANVVRLDDDDPYLVVAADKGTATFSDIANSISRDHEFWLDDAFASGGRTGYDHKAMGITARGAWESVKRHFRSLDKNIQRETFTVIGIGDMSGDVFGNGMLLSRKIQLIAAFNHLHIFVDPNPDTELSWAERKRLFELPRSTWDDYTHSLISAGGGVFARSAKRINLTDEIRERFCLDAKQMTPNDFIHHLLKAPADLLWNGGIGTYVKAESETHEDAADRSSDALRVNGSELGCKVIGEGGNLGMTQLGRIEFCMSGGLCFTDFVDNSAGVHSSDYEVNIKVLLNAVVARGDLGEEERNAFLASMTDDVASLVLRENYRQTRALGYANFHRDRLFPELLRLMKSLESTSDLDRQLEFLPDNETLVERVNMAQTLVAPEIAVLQAYAKMEIYKVLMESALPDDPWLEAELVDYFPNVLVERYRGDLWQHPLRREIISTQITNKLVDFTHASYVQRISELTNATTEDIAGAFIAATSLFDIDNFLDEIAELDNVVNSATQNRLLALVIKLIEDAVLKLILLNTGTSSLAEITTRLEPGIKEFKAEHTRHLLDDLGHHVNQRALQFEESGVPCDLARRVAGAPLLAIGLDVVRLTDESALSPATVTRYMFETVDFLHLDTLSTHVDELIADTDWHIAAKARLRRDLALAKHRLMQRILGQCDSDSLDKSGQELLRESFGDEVDAFRLKLIELNELANVDFAICSVAIDGLRQLLGE